MDRTDAWASSLARLLDTARAEAAEGARRGALTDSVVDALRGSRLLKMFLPSDLEGMGLALPEACELISVVSEADGAAGWAVMIGSGPNWFAGHMPSGLAQEVFGPADSSTAGSGIPGTAESVPSGLRVSGTWRWCSGAPWATWFTFAVRAVGSGDGDRAEDVDLVVAVPAHDVNLDLGSWDVRGLAATASVDVCLDSVIVPTAHTFRVSTDTPQRPEPAFRVPFLAFAEATMAAVAIGVSRRLLAEIADLARTKTPSFGTGVLADDPVVRDRFARAHALVRSAEHWASAAVADLWDAVIATPVPLEADSAVLVEHRLAAVHAVATAATAADLLRPLTGMTTLPVCSTLGRVLADAQAIGHNAVVGESRLAEIGAVLLAPETSAPAVPAR